jgi:nucleoside-diphosphate-sugar epimerase
MRLPREHAPQGRPARGKHMLKGKKILVTGGTGNIGAPIVEDFARDNEVWCAARFSNAQLKADFEARGVKTCFYDMWTGDTSGLPDDFDYVVHSGLVMGAEMTEHETAIRINTESTALLMQHCRKAKGFLHLSAASVYRRHPDHPHHAYVETDDLATDGATYSMIYPTVKIAVEGAVRAVARVLGLPTVIARMNAAYGVHSHGGVAVMYQRMMAAGKPIAVPIGYDNIGSPIAAKDIGRQAHLLLEAATCPATIVNWAGDEGVNDRDLCAYIGELTGLTPTYTESKITLDVFLSDNTLRKKLIGDCEVHWKDGLRDTFRRLGVLKPGLA